MELSERDLTAIHDTHDKVIRMESVLGNGSSGLCYDVRCHNRRLQRLEILFAFILGSGILGGSIFGLVKLLGA